MKKRVAARDVFVFCPETALRLETSSAFAPLGFHTPRRGIKVPQFVVLFAAPGPTIIRQERWLMRRGPWAETRVQVVRGVVGAISPGPFIKRRGKD